MFWKNVEERSDMGGSRSERVSMGDSALVVDEVCTKVDAGMGVSKRTMMPMERSVS